MLQCSQLDLVTEAVATSEHIAILCAPNLCECVEGTLLRLMFICCSNTYAMFCCQIITLVDRMERLRVESIHVNIQASLDQWLEAIKKVQTMRKEEIMNASDRYHHGGQRHPDDKGKYYQIMFACPDFH